MSEPLIFQPDICLFQWHKMSVSVTQYTRCIVQWLTIHKMSVSGAVASVFGGERGTLRGGSCCSRSGFYPDENLSAWAGHWVLGTGNWALGTHFQDIWYLFCICVVIWILCHLVELNVYHLRANVIIIKLWSPDQNNQHNYQWKNNYQCFRNKSVFPCPTSATTSLTKNSVISNEKEWWW